ANYYQVFQGACAGHGAACTGIQHLFRRNDESGTSDLFIGAVNAGAIGQQDNNVTFCNTGTKGPGWGTVVASDGHTCNSDADCSLGGTCVAWNGSAIKFCENHKTCTADTDCGATGFITTGGCTNANTDCRGVPAKACSADPNTTPPGGVARKM